MLGMAPIPRPESIQADLADLPLQPDALDWPTEQWPRGEHPDDPDEFERRCAALFDLTSEQGVTYAALVVQGGRILFERYDAGANPLYLQYSWSMAKSVTHALAGILVRDGRLDVYARAAVPEWQGANDPRREITVDQLLCMRSGLEFHEDYVDGGASDVIPMLSFEGRHDTGHFAASKPLLQEPGSTFSYSSGTTNIICRILRDIVGNGPTGMLEFMHNELLEPLGMRTPTPRFDTSGTFIGSSFLFATPQDFARFGYLYLRDGVWDDQRILPEGWVDYGRSCTYQDAEQAYGAHWWLKPQTTQFYAGGYDGQRVLVVPEKDLLVVRCGRTNIDNIQPIWDKVDRIVDLF